MAIVAMMAIDPPRFALDGAAFGFALTAFFSARHPAA